ncbi:hypothetical protein BDP55DRAFT_214132 [Colletotrichum godetiae]|uniref:Uncharacterized protein n=1 Tax=Colletotrichum godetiae TaxID=1209918 RepID=A0AAJ0B1L5_9PEZI|nr:uncharacterized protein BDP55DRAFT_214132 [Colletotrichum godetiae]KAK1700012.1 hypothetical protein BDP55DRAFT_214132 [Colletotrichum godetiae]
MAISAMHTSPSQRVSTEKRETTGGGRGLPYETNTHAEWSRLPYMEKFCSPCPFGTAFRTPSYRIKRLNFTHLDSWHRHPNRHRLAFRVDTVSTPDLGARTASEDRSLKRWHSALFPYRRVIRTPQ